MTDRPRVLGLVVHPSNDVRASVAAVVGAAARNGSRVIARAADAERFGGERFGAGGGVEAVTEQQFVEQAEFVFSLGGDGTMLGAMRLVAGRPTPVLGVNHGNVGFLIEVMPVELPRAIERLIAGDFGLEPHSGLEFRLNGGEPAVAFNDVVVTAATPWTSVSLDLEINGVRHGYFRGDAVVACTPTGSTAYNYAAGGPILSPSVPVIALTPVAPMSGISRSIVLGGDEAITLRTPGDGTAARISLDGAIIVTAQPGAEMTVRLQANAVNVVRFDRATHGNRTRVKLSLLDLPLRPDQLIELVPERLRERLRGVAD